MTAETVPRIVPVGSKNRASRANANSRLLQSRTKNRRILENRPFYAASRMSQLRKLSSAASHFLRKTCDLTLSSFAMKHRMVAGSILPGNSLRKHVQMALPQRAVPRNVAPLLWASGGKSKRSGRTVRVADSEGTESQRELSRGLTFQIQPRRPGASHSIPQV
jgi:hypothetical protein